MKKIIISLLLTLIVAFQYPPTTHAFIATSENIAIQKAFGTAIIGNIAQYFIAKKKNLSYTSSNLINNIKNDLQASMQKLKQVSGLAKITDTNEVVYEPFAEQFEKLIAQKSNLPTLPTAPSNSGINQNNNTSTLEQQNSQSIAVSIPTAEDLAKGAVIKASGKAGQGGVYVILQDTTGGKVQIKPFIGPDYPQVGSAVYVDFESKQQINYVQVFDKKIPPNKIVTLEQQASFGIKKIPFRVITPVGEIIGIVKYSVNQTGEFLSEDGKGSYEVSNPNDNQYRQKYEQKIKELEQNAQ